MLLKLLSRLPLEVLYPLARLIYFIIYYVVRYRRALVFEHLRAAFPQLSKQEIKRLAKGFYRNLSDISVETLKMISMTQEELEERVVHNNPELLQSLADEGNSLVLLSAHVGNWEWLHLALGLKVPLQMNSAYKPIHNKQVDRIFYEMRSKFGANLVGSAEYMDVVIKNRKTQQAYAFLADQKPRGTGKCHFTEFLNRETRFFTGPEKVAQFAKAPVVFLSMRRVRRGYYEVDYQLLARPPYEKQKDQYPITELYARAVEKLIREQPDSWLWSNRRWRIRNPGQPANQSLKI